MTRAEKNRKQLEAERLAAHNLKQMKTRQYEADLAAHLRNERMRALEARNRRNEQDAAKEATLQYEEHMAQIEREARAESNRHFNDVRAHKRAEKEELRQKELYQQQAIVRTPVATAAREPGAALANAHAAPPSGTRVAAVA